MRAYLADPISILKVWEGGLAIYGGVIGAIVGMAIFCRIKKLKLTAVLDLILMVFLLGQSIGRWGNFMNREAFGAATDSFFRMGLFNTKTNAWEYLTSIISDPLLLQVLSAPATCKMELRKETLPLFTYVHGIAPFIESSWRLAGDGNMLVSCLVEQIRAYGGEVLTDKDVVSLKEEDGRIVQALCVDGTSYEAVFFVSNAHPAVTCSLVGESALMKKVFRRRMGMQPNTFGIFTLHLQLRSGSLPYFNHNKLVFAEPDCWDMAVDKSLAVKGIMMSARMQKKLWLGLCCLIGALMLLLNILTPMLWEVVEEYDGTKLFHRPKAYKEMKARVAEQCLALAETVIPGLGEMILKTWSSTPLTYKDYNLTPEGSAFGFRKDFSNPMMTIVSPKTQIPNLFMTGQSLMLHGLHGVTMTAAYTCQEINKNTISE